MRSLCRVVSIFLAFAALVLAQTTSGSIAGSVVDSAGAAVVGVTVAVKNLETKAAFEATTRVSGDFLVTNLQAAPYWITIEQPGFKKFEQTNVVLTSNTNISVGEIVLQVGTLQQSVEVVAQGRSTPGENGNRSASATSGSMRAPSTMCSKTSAIPTRRFRITW